MPRISSTLNLESLYASKASDDRYSYSTIDLKDSLTPASQLSVRWNLLQVTRQSDLTQVTVADLGFFTQELIQVIPSTLYTVDVVNSNVVLSDIGDRFIDFGGETYIIPTYDSLNIDASNPIAIVRATDVSSSSGSFASGSRLTSQALNAANDRQISAIEELSYFGTSSDSSSGGSGGGASTLVDINDISNVAITFTPGTLLQVSGDGSKIVSAGSSLGGSLMPSGGTANDLLIKDSSIDGDASWGPINTSNVAYGATTLTSGLSAISIDINDLEALTTGFTRTTNTGEDLTSFSDKVIFNNSYTADSAIITGDLQVQGNIDLSGTLSGSFAFSSIDVVGAVNVGPTSLTDSGNGPRFSYGDGDTFSLVEGLQTRTTIDSNGSLELFSPSGSLSNGAYPAMTLTPTSVDADDSVFSFTSQHAINPLEADVAFNIEADGKAYTHDVTPVATPVSTKQKHQLLNTAQVDNRAKLNGSYYAGDYGALVDEYTESLTSGIANDYDTEYWGRYVTDSWSNTANQETMRTRIKTTASEALAYTAYPNEVFNIRIEGSPGVAGTSRISIRFQGTLTDFNTYVQSDNAGDILGSWTDGGGQTIYCIWQLPTWPPNV